MEKIKNKFLDIVAWSLTEGPKYFWMSLAVTYFVFLLGLLIFSLITNPITTLIHMGIILSIAISILAIFYTSVKISIWKEEVYSWAVNRRQTQKTKTENEK